LFFIAFTLSYSGVDLFFGLFSFVDPLLHNGSDTCPVLLYLQDTCLPEYRQVRKIRCDSAVGGCSPCRQTQATCKTTDRITGKATVRGLTDILEGENRKLRAQLKDYQQQLQRLGVSVEPTQASPNYEAHTPVPETEEDTQHWDPRRKDSHIHMSGSTAGLLHEEPSLFHKHITNASGSLSQNPVFSMFRGTKLALFGMQIDLAEFADDESDHDSPKDFNGFMEHIFKQLGPAVPAPLPPTLQDARNYAQWYFKFLNPYTAVIDKRDMENLVSAFACPL
jgi:hypothetical protein